MSDSTLNDEEPTGLAQKAGAEAAFKARGLALESAATAFPRFATEGATVITF
ncbi:MAG: hypothetical protein U5L74_07445 [Ideonella sp.]|nr:hypothetical protein [Ideonella sp.]